MRKNLHHIIISNRDFFLFFISLFVVSFAQPSFSPLLCILAAVLGYGLFWFVYRKILSRKKAFLTSVIWFFCVELSWQSWLCSTKYQGICMVIVYLSLCLIFALQFGVLSLFLYRKTIGLRQILLVPAIWTIMEMSRVLILTGHLWNPTGLALCGSHFSMLLASFGGVYLLTFWVILSNVCFLCMIEKQSYYHWFAGVVLFPYLFGFITEKIHINTNKENDFTVLLVQTGLFPEEKNFFSEFPDKAVRPLEQWKRILLSIGNEADRKLDLIVFPESAVPFGSDRSFYDLESMQSIWNQSFNKELTFSQKHPFVEKKYGKWFVSNAFINQSISDHFGCEVICGLDHIENSKSYNSAFHYEPNNVFHTRYDKQILVPIGEYLPFASLAPLAHQFGLYNFFEKGNETKLFSKKRPLAVSICLEEIYPDLMRKNRLKGAEYFVNISNDGWFPNTNLASQHFDHGVLRAVENGVYLFRSCCTGVTGVVDPFGRIVKILESNGRVIEKSAGCLVVSIPFYHYYTFYTLWGENLILGICFLICLFECRRVISKNGLGLA